MSGLKQLPERIEKGEAEHREEQGVFQREGIFHQQGSAGENGADDGQVDDPFRCEKAGEIDAHEFEDPFPEGVGFLRQDLRAVLFAAEQLDRLDAPQALQIISRQVFHTAPVIPALFFDLRTERIVERQQKDRSQSQDEGCRMIDAAEPEVEINRGCKAVQKPGKVLGIVDLHGFHRIHGGGDGGDRSQRFDAPRIQCHDLGKDLIAQKHARAGRAPVFQFAFQQVEQQDEACDAQGGKDRAACLRRGNGGVDHAAQQSRNGCGKMRDGRKRKQPDRCNGSDPAPESFRQAEQGFVDEKHGINAFPGCGCSKVRRGLISVSIMAV